MKKTGKKFRWLIDYDSIDMAQLQRNSKKSTMILAVLAPLLVGFITYGFLRIKKENKELNANPVYSTAIVIKVGKGYKGKPFFSYQFKVGSTMYTNGGDYMAHRQLIIVGDTCEIIYAKTNPEINRVLKYENKQIKIRPLKK